MIFLNAVPRWLLLLSMITKPSIAFLSTTARLHHAPIASSYYDQSWKDSFDFSSSSLTEALKTVSVTTSTTIPPPTLDVDSILSLEQTARSVLENAKALAASSPSSMTTASLQDFDTILQNAPDTPGLAQPLVQYVIDTLYEARDSPYNPHHIMESLTAASASNNEVVTLSNGFQVKSSVLDILRTNAETANTAKDYFLDNLQVSYDRSSSQLQHMAQSTSHSVQDATQYFAQNAAVSYEKSSTAIQENVLPRAVQTASTVQHVAQHSMQTVSAITEQSTRSLADATTQALQAGSKAASETAAQTAASLKAASAQTAATLQATGEQTAASLQATGAQTAASLQATTVQTAASLQATSAQTAASLQSSLQAASAQTAASLQSSAQAAGAHTAASLQSATTQTAASLQAASAHTAASLQSASAQTAASLQSSVQAASAQTAASLQSALESQHYHVSSMFSVSHRWEDLLGALSQYEVMNDLWKKGPAPVVAGTTLGLLVVVTVLLQQQQQASAASATATTRGASTTDDAADAVAALDSDRLEGIVADLTQAVAILTNELKDIKQRQSSSEEDYAVAQKLQLLNAQNGQLKTQLEAAQLEVEALSQVNDALVDVNNLPPPPQLSAAALASMTSNNNMTEAYFISAEHLNKNKHEGWAEGC